MDDTEAKELRYIMVRQEMGVMDSHETATRIRRLLAAADKLSDTAPSAVIIPEKRAQYGQ
jgi:hypothetical protein